MSKSKTIFICLILLSLASFAQPQQKPVVINKKVEVVEYQYEYFFIEYETSAFVSTFYPIYQSTSPTDEQLFFEAGRNERMGFEAGIQQAIKIDKWFFATGVHYQLFNENFSYGEYQVREVEIQNNEGVTEVLSVAVGEAVVTNHLNQLGYLKIPFQFHYQTKLLKSDLDFNVGVNYHRLVYLNYSTKHSLNQPAGVLSMADFNPSYLSLSGGVSITRNINENLKVKLGPYFNYGLTNLIDQDNLSYGLSYVGLNFMLAMCY